MKRCTLHKTHLEDLKIWLREIKQIPYRDGKGHYQILQILVPLAGWQVVFSKAYMPEHFSANEKLMPIIREFYRSRKQAKRKDCEG